MGKQAFLVLDVLEQVQGIHRIESSKRSVQNVPVTKRHRPPFRRQPNRFPDSINVYVYSDQLGDMLPDDPRPLSIGAADLKNSFLSLKHLGHEQIPSALKY